MAKKVTKTKAVKPSSKKSATKKVAKKAVKKTAKKAPAKKAPAKKAPAKKAPAKKAPAKKAPAKKAPAKKAPAKKAPAKKAPAKKAPTRKAANESTTVAALKKVAKKPVKRAVRKVIKTEELEPVVVKRPYVKPEKVAKLTQFEKRQQKRLLDLRDQITDSIYGIQNDTIKNGNEGSDSSGSGMHQGDAGSDAYDRDFALTMLSKEANALGEIEQALQRLELGIYGICEESGQKIPQPRLEAMPFARLTVECQAAKEKNEAMTDYSSREYGFN